VVQASVRALAIGAGIDFGRRYKDQSITKLSKLMVAVSVYVLGRPLANFKQAREAEPYLARFEDDCVTGQIIRQYINGKRKYENAKASGRVKAGVTRKGMMRPTSDNMNMRMSLEVRDDNGSGSEEEEWHGINWFSNRNHGMDIEFEGNSEEEDTTPGGADNDD